jgi:hypothetical protein
MRPARLAPSALLPLTLLAGCTDSATLPTAADTPAPAFAQGNAPPTSGPNVQRGVPAGFSLGADPETQLVVLAGIETTVEQLCADPVNVPVTLLQQVVATPSGHVQFNAPPQEVRVDVFQFAGGIVTDACQLIGAPLVATGTATARFVQVNLGGGESRAAAINATVHGIVELVTAGQARVQASGHIQFKDGVIVLDKETVTLTPL